MSIQSINEDQHAPCYYKKVLLVKKCLNKQTKGGPKLTSTDKTAFEEILLRQVPAWET